MKKFRFRLQPLLKMREQLERERQKELARATMRVREQERENLAVAQRREQTVSAHRGHLHGRLVVGQLLLYSRYQQKLKRDGLLGQELLRGMRKEEDRKRNSLMEAARERKKYEKLRDRLAEKHTRKGIDAEKKETDEIALNNFRLKH